mgnify:CR=1 FL=1
MVGHISLAESMNDAAEYIPTLVEALHQSGVHQHVFVRNATLAKRLAAVEGVDVGPIVHSPVMATCLMPKVDIVHVHEPTAGRAGLLLTLTRSIPYVLTPRGTNRLTGTPLLQAVYARAAAVICQDDCEIAIVRHALPELRVEIIPELGGYKSARAHVRLYQNSQRMPIAGNKGIQ